jgi:hypothetical protein
VNLSENQRFYLDESIPSLSMLGWNIFVLNRTLGGTIGYSSGRYSSASNRPPSNEVSYGPAILTMKCLGFFSLGSAYMPTTSHYCENLIV